MHIRKYLLAATALGASLLPSQATLVNFTDHSLGGTTASWDIFYGGNYLPFFSFETGTSGNPILNSTSNISLNMQVIGYKPSFPGANYATGPLGSDGGSVGDAGDREQFYTFMSSNGAWSMNMAAVQDVSQVIFQVQEISDEQDPLETSVIPAIFLNGIAGTLSFDTDTFVSTWTWTGLDVDAGSGLSLTWNTGQHQGFEAFQLQTDGQVIPEPTAAALVACSGLALILRRRTRNRQ